MKSKLSAALAILLIVALGISTLAHSGQVAKNSYEESFPYIKGDYLVWQGKVNGDWEIFLYNIATQELRRITDNDYDDISPQTDGHYVVWLGFSYSGGEIFVYDVLSGETTQITTDDRVDSPPQIANGLVVWTSHQVTDSVEPGEIFLYDIVTGLRKQLTDNILDDSSSRINAESVMWVQVDDAGITTLFIYDLLDGPAYEAPEDYVWQDSPQTDGDLTVSTRHDGNDREIVVHNKSVKAYDQITDNDLEDRSPSISRNNITWVGGEGQASEIFLNVDVDPIDTDFYLDEPNATQASSTSPGSPSTNGGGGGSSGGGGCFIATAAFGSYVDPHVKLLRDFRDEYLITNTPGRCFVSAYYKYGPLWADFLNTYTWCKPAVRLALMPLVGVSYLLLKASFLTKLLTGCLLMGFVVIGTLGRRANNNVF